MIPIQTNGTVAKEVVDAVADLMEIEYRYIIIDLPLYTIPFEQPDIVIQLNADGVRNLKLKIPPTFINSKQAGTLIGQQSAIEMLRNGNGQILKTSKMQYTEGGELFNVSNMTITNISLGYIFDGNKSLLGYMFQGVTPNSKNPSETYSVEVGVAALK